MAESSIFYYNPEVAVGVPRELVLCYDLSQAGGTLKMTPRPHCNAAISATGTADFTQEQIDAFLGSTDEFTVSQFARANTRPADYAGLIINMGGQAADVVTYQALADDYGANYQWDQGERVATLPTTGTQTNAGVISVSSAGNLGLVWDMGPSSDAYTDGLVTVRILWVPK